AMIQFAVQYTALISLLRKQGPPDVLLDALESRARTFPKVARHHLELADQYYQSKRIDDALVSYRAALPLIDTSMESRPLLQWWAWSMIGACLHDLNRMAEAVEPLQRAVDIGQKGGAGALVTVNQHAETALHLGNALAALERYPDARTAFTRALALQPTFLQARINLGFAWQMAGNPWRARSEHHHALEQSPTSATVHYMLGWASSDLGELGPALSEYRRALEL